MKKILLFLLIGITTNLFSQDAKEKAVTIHQPQSFRLVSQSNAIVGSRAKVVLDVKLPPNTIRWFYSITASRNKDQIKRTQTKLNLVGQLTKIIDQSGTSAKALSLLTAPPGDNFCNVYLMSSYNDARTFEKELSLDGFSYIRNGSRQNFKSGPVEIQSPEYCKGTQYIGISNPSGFYGVSVAIEVVAIVFEGWKGEDKQKFHDAISTLMISNGALDYLEEKQVEELTTCILNKFTKKFTPQDLENKANYEVEKEFNQIAEKCSFELGIEDIEEKTVQKKQEINTTPIEPSRPILVGTWKDNNSVFTLKENGSFYIKWDNQNQAWGKWAFEKGMLYIQLGEGQKYIPQKFISFSQDEMKYQAVGDETIYTAKRIK